MIVVRWAVDNHWETKQVQNTADLINGFVNPIVLLGTLNVEPNTEQFLYFLNSTGLQNACQNNQNFAYTNRSTQKTVDYILYKGLSLIECFPLDPSFDASEHVAVVASFNTTAD